MEIVVDNSQYLAKHGKLPTDGYVEYQIGADIHGYSKSFTYAQSLAIAKQDAQAKGVSQITLRA